MTTDRPPQCPQCTATMCILVDEACGREYICVDCGEEIEIVY